MGASPRLLPLPALLLVLVTCASPQPSQEDVLARSRSPHGSIAVSCASCHAPEAWTPLRSGGSFDHATQTAFELSGAHERVDCRSCHLSLRFDEPHGSSGDCAGCHVDVHAGRLGTACSACHDTRSFAASGQRDAHAGTSFPLVGRHRQITCESCHGGGGAERYSALPTECMSCHAADYERAVPEHAGAGFPTQCASCHGMMSWRGARFDHASVAGYPLEGAHNRIDCESCHTPPSFALRFTPAGPRDCISCHQVDYDRVHPNLGFTTDCLACHALETFRGARWAEHDARFPIYSGKHAGRWTSCAQCHEGTGYATVSCLNCHEHSQTRMDDKHKERAGYSYTTAACLSCHPRGDKE